MRPSRKLLVLARNYDAPGYPWRAQVCDILAGVFTRLGL